MGFIGSNPGRRTGPYLSASRDRFEFGMRTGLETQSCEGLSDRKRRALQDFRIKLNRMLCQLDETSGDDSNKRIFP